MAATERAVVLISNDLSHPALKDQQYAFSWRINRLRPLLKKGYTLILVAAGGRVGPRGRPTLMSLAPQIRYDGRLVIVSPPILRLPMIWLVQSAMVTPLMVFLYCRGRGLKVDLVVGSAVPYGLVAKVLNKLLGAALIIDYGDPDYAREKGAALRVLHFLESFVLGSKEVDAVTCIDPNICDYVKRYGRKDAVFLPPGGYWADQAPASNRPSHAGTMEVIYAGHVAPPPAYRLDLLIEAAAKVTADNPRARFVILGDGEYLPVLRKRVMEMGLEGRVELPGPVPYAEAKKRIAGADVAVQVLNDMCLGTKVIDYFCEARAVVSCGEFYASYKEFLVDGENCLLVPPSADKLAGAISTLLSDERLRKRLGAKARETLRAYDWDSQADVVLRLASLKA